MDKFLCRTILVISAFLILAIQLKAVTSLDIWIMLFIFIGTMILLTAIFIKKFQEAIDQANTDALTGLYNHGYFQKQLMDQFEQAKRNQMVFSLLLLDIDDFKNYNDTYGHPEGDKCLKRFSHLLKSFVGEKGMVARYGGEEFAVILPHMDMETSLQFSKQIQIQMRMASLEGIEGPAPGFVSYSAGLSTINNHTKDRYDLIEQADKALYYSKRHGKNQTRAYMTEHMETMH